MQSCTSSDQAMLGRSRAMLVHMRGVSELPSDLILGFHPESRILIADCGI